MSGGGKTMSYFDDQEDAWIENDCKGNIEDYNPFDPDSWPKKHTPEVIAATVPKTRTEAQKARKRRNRARKNARRRANAEAAK
jgi:hypothetical protein